ncbi:MAG: gamma-glutamylcyclotransferase family protein [Geminicoccaceae bacterium]
MRQSLAIARQPLDVAEMIPLHAAGRDPLFFFGTLMDTDVLTYVLGRPIDLDDLEPAVLTGFRRVRTRDATYPVLVDAPGETVEGRMLRKATRRDIVRINHYESEEYRAERHPVRCGRGIDHGAWLYMALDALVASEDPWHLDHWAHHHKPTYFDACDGWMEGCPEIG